MNNHKNFNQTLCEVDDDVNNSIDENKDANFEELSILIHRFMANGKSENHFRSKSNIKKHNEEDEEIIVHHIPQIFNSRTSFSFTPSKNYIETMKLSSSIFYPNKRNKHLNGYLEKRTNKVINNRWKKVYCSFINKIFKIYKNNNLMRKYLVLDLKDSKRNKFEFM